MWRPSPAGALRRAPDAILSYRGGVPPQPDEVFTITEAQRGLSQEQTGRTRRYLISMGIRTACVLAAILVPGWPRWAFIAGAVILPYLAVVIANAGRENDEPGQVGVSVPDRMALPAPGISLAASETIVTPPGRPHPSEPFHSS